TSPVTVSSTAAGTDTQVWIEEGYGEKKFAPVDIGNAAGTLDDLHGPLLLITTQDVPRPITLHDGGSEAGHLYTCANAFDPALEFFAGSIDRDATSLIKLSGTPEVTIDAGSGPDTFLVLSDASPLHLNGNDGDDNAIVGAGQGLDLMYRPVTFDG